MPGVCSQAWSVSLGLCRATGRHGNGGNRPALATDPGNGSDPRQLFVASPPVLLSAPPPLLRYGGVCLALWSLHNIHWRSWERCLKVPFEASGGWGESGVQMDQALSFPPSPHNLWFNQRSSILTSAWNVEWKESMVQKCSENQKTRPLCFKLPSWPINGSHNLVGWIS